MSELPSEVAALRRITFFEELTDADLLRLARTGQRRSYAAGDTLVEKDSDRGGFFVLLSGEAKVEAGSTFHVLSPGDFSARRRCSQHRAERRRSVRRSRSR